MEDTLNNVIIGGRNLKVNVARYARLQRSETVRDSGRRNELGNTKENNVIVRSNGLSIGRSFKDVVNNSVVGGREIVETKMAKIVIPEAVNLGCPVWLDNCLIGEVIDIELLSNFFSIFQNSGIAECSIKYAGGLMVILKFESKVPENVELPVVQSVENSSEGVDLAKQSAKKVSHEHGIKGACTRDLHSKNDEFQDVQESRKGIACARDLHSNNYEFQVVQEPMKGIAYACENINTPSQDGGSGTSLHYWANNGGPRSEGGIEDSGPNGFLEVSNGGDNFSPYISRSKIE
ncbi:hypothetical protein L2E82_23089 [Cichorium intybus]|uniref:Uncharacterized protein n=1 Tax=Cichorium intybus TaxID=13427 RepID=A0ACB9E0K7_CICIN|nr:hypothetical protein L2E82_23089 [Cichorium intybus]